MTDLRELSLQKNQLQALPDLPAGLLTLSVSFNQLEYLPALPPGLKDLSASWNRLKELPAPPPSLTSLSVTGNDLTQLPPLNCPLHLAMLSRNRLTSLNGLPDTLGYLSVEPELITTTINQLEARIATLMHDTDLYAQQLDANGPATAAGPAHPPQARPVLPGPFGRLNAETAEALLANLEPGSADFASLSGTNSAFHQELQPKIDADKEIETINTALTLLRHLQQINRP